MFDTVCSFPLESELFAQAIHPTAPIIAVGLAEGHVESYRLPPIAGEDADSDDDDDTTTSVNGTGHIETLWRTRRHKGSCRSLAYSLDGSVLFSAGTDGLVKVADSESGKVVDKIAVPNTSNDRYDDPSLLHILSPQTCLMATDSSALHLYDLRVPTKGKTERGFAQRRPQQTHYPHLDYISSLTPLPPTEASTSGYSKQWVSTGGTTLAVTDLRRGVLVKSEDQEEELLSTVFVSGLSRRGGGTSTGEKIVVGGAGGVLTLWEKGQWDDQDERIVVDKGDPIPGAIGESLDCLVTLPDGVGAGGKIIAVGMGDGNIKFVKMNKNEVIGGVRHDDVEGVIGLGFDVGGRMISGGGSVVKVWHDKVDEDNGGYVDHSDDDSHDGAAENGNGREASDSSDEEREVRPQKKRKGGSGNHLPGGGSFTFSGLD